jgi:hypothetical protein
VPEEKLAAWRDYFTVSPSYEDDDLLAYRTHPVPGRDFTVEQTLGSDLALVQASVTPTRTTQGGVMSLDLRWTATYTPTQEYAALLSLLNPLGEVAQGEMIHVCKDWPTSHWGRHALAVGRHQIQVDPHLPPALYQVTLTIIEETTGSVLSPAQTIGTLDVSALERRFTAPAMQHTAAATFGNAMTLLGYDLHHEASALHLTLHWQALHRLDYYKVFVRLHDAQSGSVVVQSDTVPRQWSYPTNWWESGEVVSDEVTLSLEDIPSGVYRVEVGVYNPETLERLPVQTESGAPLGDHLQLEEMVRLP